MKLGRWSTTANSNNTAPPDGWPEGQAPSTVNDCAREMMASIRTVFEDAQYFDQDFTPTYITSTTFSVPGNQTSAIHAGRRLKIYDASAGSATTIYATVLTASFTTVTTIAISADAGQLTTSLSSFAVAIISANNNSLPRQGLALDRLSASAIETTTLTASGAVTLLSTLSVSGATTLASTLSVSGATVLKAALSVGGAVALGTTLGVSGASTLAGTLSVSGATVLQGALSLGGAATFGTTLSVSGATVLQGALSLGGAATFGTTLSVSGATVLAGATTLASTLTASGAVVLLGSLSISAHAVAGTYFKTGAITVGSLPAAGTVGAGARYLVTDANGSAFAAAVAAGGANVVPVYSDGTVWRIG